MVGQGGKAVCLQLERNFIDVLAAEAIDNARSLDLILIVIDEAEQLVVGLFRFLFDFVVQVLAVEARDVHFGIIESKLLHDVCAYSLGSRCGQRNDWNLRVALFELEELPVLGAKIVAPF